MPVVVSYSTCLNVLPKAPLKAACLNSIVGTETKATVRKGLANEHENFDE